MLQQPESYLRNLLFNLKRLINWSCGNICVKQVIGQLFRITFFDKNRCNWAFTDDTVHFLGGTEMTNNGAGVSSFR